MERMVNSFVVTEVPAIHSYGKKQPIWKKKQLQKIFCHTISIRSILHASTTIEGIKMVFGMSEKPLMGVIHK